MVRIVLLGTCDTKLAELLFLREAILRADPDIDVFFIDIGRSHTDHPAIQLSPKQLRNYVGKELDGLPRGEFVQTMAECATKAVERLCETSVIHGVVAAGGSSGTSVVSAVMRNALSVGLPKLIVSTIASGDTGPIVEETDITLMYSVVDIAGLNYLLRRVLNNAGAAIAGMAKSYASRQMVGSRPMKKRVGITMFGVTTPGVDAIRAHLESKYDVETYIFHATGHGGKAMERLIREGGLDAVLDLTTTEVCDFLTGGVMSAGGQRLEAAARAGIPNIVSVGATDMTNFGPKNTVPERYKNRKLHEHTYMVTLMRTSVKEARKVGDFITTQLKKHATNPDMVEVWLPEGGISMMSTSDGPFADAEADSALFQAVRDGLSGTSIKVVEDNRAVNDPDFAQDIAEALAAKMGLILTSH